MQKAENRIKSEGFMQGVISLVFSQVVIKIFGLVYKLYLTNREGFGDEGNAIYSSGFQIYALLLALSSIGVPNAVAKLVSEKISIGDTKGSYKIFKTAFFLFGIIGFIGTLILFAGANVISNKWLQIPEAELALVSLSPSIFFVSIISVIRGYFNGRQTMKATANSQTIEQLLKTIFTIILVEGVVIVSGVDTKLMAAGANFATTVATMGSFCYLYKYYKIKNQEIRNEIIYQTRKKQESYSTIIKKIIKTSMPMSISAILASINKNVDSVTVVRGLKEFLTEKEAKIQYGILSGKVDTLVMLPLSFNIAFATTLVPTISSLIAKGDYKTIERRISFSLMISMLIGLPCTIGMIFFADPILKLMFPNASSGADILKFSAISIVFTMLEQTTNGALQGIGKIFVPAISLLIGVTVKIVLNIILIRIPESILIIGGVNGAALATSICHIIAFFISYTTLKRSINLKLSKSKFVVKPIISCIMMIICSKGIYNILNGIIEEKMSIIISLVIAIFVYFTSVIVLKEFSKDEIMLMPSGKKIFKILTKLKLYNNKEEKIAL